MHAQTKYIYVDCGVMSCHVSTHHKYIFYIYFSSLFDKYEITYELTKNFICNKYFDIFILKNEQAFTPSVLISMCNACGCCCHRHLRSLILLSSFFYLKFYLLFGIFFDLPIFFKEKLKKIISWPIDQSVSV